MNLRDIQVHLKGYPGTNFSLTPPVIGSKIHVIEAKALRVYARSAYFFAFI